MDKTNRQFICGRKDLQDQPYLIRDINYKKRPTSAIIFAFQGQVYAYVNHCMHMQRPLNCQQDAIFDASGRLLRCSMHGFVFEPTTGECLSPVCAGQLLQSLKIEVRAEAVYFSDKHVRLIN